MEAGSGQSDIRASRGFTLVEVIFVILLIAVLLSIALVGIRAASRSAQGAADRQTVVALKVGVDSFQQEFGFLPPLVKGADPADDPFDTASERINVYRLTEAVDRDFLRGRSGSGATASWSSKASLRYSEQSLPYFLAGALGASVDGVEGPGMRAPRRDGTFATSGQTYPSYVDVSKRTLQLQPSDDVSRPYVISFTDRNGIRIRYYQWLSETSFGAGTGTAGLNVPFVLGTPSMDGSSTASAADSNPAMRSAKYAIVAAGPNRAFGDIQIGSGDSGTEELEDVRARIGASGAKAAIAVEQEARGDNIVEVGG